MTWKVKQDSPYFISCLNDSFITYNTTGSFFIGDGSANDIAVYPGYLQFPEIADPGTPAANTGWLYTADDGSGNTKLYFENNSTKYDIAGPAGSDGEIQFNNSGLVDGDSNLTWNTGTSQLSVTGGYINAGGGITVPTEQPIWLNGSTTSDAVLYAKETGVTPNEKNALYLGIGVNVGRNLVICDAVNYGKAAYFNADDPTLFIQSSSDPLVTPNEHLLLGFAAGYGAIISTPGGPLYINAGNGSHHVQIGLLGSPTHSLAAYDFFVEGDAEIDGILYADGGIIVDSADSIDCASGSLNLGGTVNVNFAGASRTASTVTHDAYVELDVGGVTYKFMLGS